MNKLAKRIGCALAFLITAFIAVSLFGLFSAWALSELGPAQQEAIAAINTPWIAAQRDPVPTSSKVDTAARQKATQERSVTTSIATKR